MSRRDVLLAAIAKSRPAVERLLAVKNRNLKQAEALVTDLASLNKQLTELASLPAEAPTVVVTIPSPSNPTSFAEALARFLDAEDAALKAAGKPHGRDGAERGAMDRESHIALAQSIGVLEALGGPTFFGPEPGPGVSA